MTAIFTRITIVWAVFFAGPLWASQNDPNVCPRKSLRQKDCHLKIENSKIQIWNDKVFHIHPLGRDTQALKYFGDKVDWDFIDTKKIGSRQFLELGVWSVPDSKTDVSTLNWIVYEIDGPKLKFLLEKPIQKRKDSRKDPRLSYGLRQESKKEKGNVLWYVEREKGSL